MSTKAIIQPYLYTVYTQSIHLRVYMYLYIEYTTPCTSIRRRCTNGSKPCGWVGEVRMNWSKQPLFQCRCVYTTKHWSLLLEAPPPTTVGTGIITLIISAHYSKRAHSNSQFWLLSHCYALCCSVSVISQSEHFIRRILRNTAHYGAFKIVHEYHRNSTGTHH